MNAVEYDLDTSGGLMDEIQRLIAPPVSEETLRRQRRGPKEFKKHGKAINHDYCDSCTEGGDLVCCDRCPASFHLQCHDPPLEEDDIPPGEWICHRCKTAPKIEKDDDASSTKSGSSNGGRSTKYTPSPIPIPVLSQNPLHTLAEAAKVLNPVQFELPKDIACTTALPGSYKRKWWGKERNMPSKKAAHELDNGMVPLPAKLCFVCNRSCRVAPLLPCDYCPCLYHLDCLDPPLTSPPTDRWMCPNHVENALDEKIVKTTSLTERVRLWDKYTSRINQHSVKLNFLKKIHRQNPPFRYKVKHPKRKSSQIPPAIMDFYHHPVELLPSHSVDMNGSASDEQTPEQYTTDTSLEEQETWLKSVISLQTGIAQYLAKKQLEKSNLMDNKTCDSAKEKPTASVQPVQNRELADKVAFNSDTIISQSSESKLLSNGDQGLPNGPLVSSEVSNSVNNGPLDVNKGAVSLLNPSNNPLNGDLFEMAEPSRSKSDSNSSNGAAGDCNVNSVSQESPQANVMKVTWPNGDKVSVSNSTQNSGNKNIVISAINRTNNIYTRVVPGVSGKASGPTSILSPRAGSQGKTGSNVLKSNSSAGSSSTKVITVNPPQSASKISIPPTSKSQPSSVASNQSSSAIISLNNTLQQCLEGTADLELSKLDEKLIQILAWQRLQQLAPAKNSTDITKKASGTLNGLLTSPGLQEVQARAVLCPLSGKGEAVPMPYRTLSIGTGADMDVCLGQFGQCNFISAKHAFIFYDETTKHYELLNYSEHGTTVDNVLYSCDFSDKPATTPQPSAVVAAVRHLNSKTKPKMKADERLTLISRVGDLKRLCNCKGSSSSLIGGSGAGWEGTAILHHGSYIKMGCIQFVFSIVDHATSQPLHGIKRESMSLLKSHLKGVP